ncbi:orotate phosphoribosyltransferase [Bacillus sp. 2205SS5-2]|uniref:orotate phosphoribosyltransferase n=1 Tax=Bacillus sp. 2205SS5-2 TaxID=3109031 RepID=UPI00300746DA
MKRILAEKLLNIGAVSLRPNNPFVWSSGLKSPIYCDNRLTLSYPELRREIAKGLAELIDVHFPKTEVIAGTATAGIPHAAWVSDLLNRPMCYVRSQAKQHGKGKQIEGMVREGQKVVVVEDLISTGGSAVNAVQALREAGCEVVGVVAIFSYELTSGIENMKKHEICSYSLADFTSLIQVTREKNLITDVEEKTLAEWKDNPDQWKVPFE